MLDLNYRDIYRLLHAIYKNFKFRKIILFSPMWQTHWEKLISETSIALFQLDIPEIITIWNKDKRFSVIEIEKILDNQQNEADYAETKTREDEISCIDRHYALYIECSEIAKLKLEFQKFLDLYSKYEKIFVYSHRAPNSIYIWDASSKHNVWYKYRLEMTKTWNSNILQALNRSYIQQSLSRFIHTLEVIKTAYKISKLIELEEEVIHNLMIACAYHDLFKNWGSEKLIRYAKRHSIEISDYSQLWSMHGPLASHYIQSKYGIKDREILEGIEFHTRPNVNLNLISQILVIADKIEPRKKERFTEDEYSNFWTLIEQKSIFQLFSLFIKPQ